jgi:hypothetical protein
VFRKYFIEKCGLTEKQVSILHAVSVVSQTIGFFTANQVYEKLNFTLDLVLLVSRTQPYWEVLHLRWG